MTTVLQSAGVAGVNSGLKPLCNSVPMKLSHACNWARATVLLAGASFLSGTWSAMYCTMGRAFCQSRAIVEFEQGHIAQRFDAVVVGAVQQPVGLGGDLHLLELEAGFVQGDVHRE